MTDQEELRRRLVVWDRIQNGTASPEDYALASAWAENHRIEALQSARPTDKWMMTTGEQIMEAWPFPAQGRADLDFPYEQILLFAILYGRSDIENGGLEQFFGNRTGDFAPETAEGLESIHAVEASTILLTCISLFGQTYPRDQEVRTKQLPALRDQLDLLTGQFYRSLPPDTEFDKACAKLLAESV